MNEDILKRYGAKKLSESPSGREYLQKLRKQYEKELLQPGDPRFLQVYGAQIEKQKKEKEKNERIARDMWGERKALEIWKKKQQQ